MPHRLTLLAALSVLGLSTQAQNIQTNNQGVIVNVIVPVVQPVYQPLNLPTVPVHTQADGDRDFQQRLNSVRVPAQPYVEVPYRDAAWESVFGHTPLIPPAPSAAQAPAGTNGSARRSAPAAAKKKAVR